MSAAKHDESKSESKKAKTDAPMDFTTEIGRIASAIKTLTDAGVGGQAAADVAMEVWQATCCESGG